MQFRDPSPFPVSHSWPSIWVILMIPSQLKCLPWTSLNQLQLSPRCCRPKTEEGGPEISHASFEHLPPLSQVWLEATLSLPRFRAQPAICYTVKRQSVRALRVKPRKLPLGLVLFYQIRPTILTIYHIASIGWKFSIQVVDQVPAENPAPLQT